MNMWTKLLEFLVSELFVVLGIGVPFITVVVIGLRSALKAAERARNAKVIQDGKKRSPTREERMAIANHLMRRKGRWFWVLVTVGIILVAASLILMRWLKASGWI